MYGLGLTHSPMFTYPAETGRSFCPYTQLKTDLVDSNEEQAAAQKITEPILDHSALTVPDGFPQN